MNIKFLQANNGDSIYISFCGLDGQNKHIIVDGGTSTTYTYKDKKTGKIKDGELKKLIDSIKPNKIDLLILTHIDDDHIDGFLKWFRHDDQASNFIKHIWFNAGRSIKKYLNDSSKTVDTLQFVPETTKTSVPQAIDFEAHIRDKGIWEEDIIMVGDKLVFENLTFRILSPGKKKLEKLLKEWEIKAPDNLKTSRRIDYSKTINEILETDDFIEDTDSYNGSSIAFLLTHGKTNFVFLADAHPSEIIASLKKLGYDKENRLAAEFIKLSHHGSQKNNPLALLEVFDTKKFVISTNGDMHGHPDKATIARIVKLQPDAKIYFNYPHIIDSIIMKQDRVDYPNVLYLDARTII